MVTAASTLDPPVGTAAWGPQVCPHTLACPSAGQSDRLAAVVIAHHPEQGWSLLCNGIVAFEDGGTLNPVPLSARLRSRTQENSAPTIGPDISNKHADLKLRNCSVGDLKRQMVASELSCFPIG